jgi:hypothetical protein
MAPEMWDEARFWFCLKHHTVESEEDRCRSDQRLGPYKSRQEAESALELARKRTEEWESDEDS